MRGSRADTGGGSVPASSSKSQVLKLTVNDAEERASRAFTSKTPTLFAASTSGWREPSTALGR